MRSKSKAKKSKKKKDGRLGMFGCTQCAKEFNTYHGLDVHIARMHNPKAKKTKGKFKKNQQTLVKTMTESIMRGLPKKDPAWKLVKKSSLLTQSTEFPVRLTDLEKQPLSCLQEAATVVRQRRENYGSPMENFKRISVMWSQLLGFTVTVRDVGRMMIAMKLARDVHSPQRDNLVDIAGYVDCIDVIDRETTAMMEVPT